MPALPESHVDEDAAYQALTEGPDPEPASRDWREPPVVAPRAAPVPRPIPPAPRAPAKKRKKAAARDPYAAQDRQWSADWGRVGGGVVGVVLGCALLFGGLAINRFFIWSPVIIMGGLFSIVSGLLHKE